MINFSVFGNKTNDGFFCFRDFDLRIYKKIKFCISKKNSNFDTNVKQCVKRIC
jgi:hypothetical protein